MASAIAMLLIVPSAQARVCEEQRACGNYVGEKAHVVQFASYAAYNTWLLSNPYVDHYELYTTASTVKIKVIDDLNYIDRCWDKQGICEIQNAEPTPL